MRLAFAGPRRKSLVGAMLAVGLFAPACDRSGGGEARMDAAPGQQDAAPGQQDAAPGQQDAAPDRGADAQAATPDQRPGDDVSAAADTSAPNTPDALGPDLRPADLAVTPSPDAAGDVGTPPNNGSVTGLTIVAANTTVGLDWPRVADAISYHIYWATAPGVDTSSQMLESSEPTFVHRGLDNGTAYHYAVAAVTAAGEGELSTEASATPGGEWVLEELGAGDFDDVVTGGRVSRLAVADRIHIVLFARGTWKTN